MASHLQTPRSGVFAQGVLALMIVSSGILLLIRHFRRRPQIFVPHEKDSIGQTPERDHKIHEKTHANLEYIRAEGRYSALFL